MITRAELEFMLRVPNQLKEISQYLERIAIALEKLEVVEQNDGGK